MIIVTGANGFIGSAFIWQLNEKGQDKIVAVDSVPQSQRSEPLSRRSFQQFLLKDEIWDYLRSQTASSQVSWIVHMGACSSTTEENVEFLRENNTEYTQRLWEWCSLHKKPFIYASSGAVYGDGTLGFDDQTPSTVFKPLNPYGESKAAFDRWLIQTKSSPPHWYGLRFFNVYGPNEYHKGDMSSVVFKAFQQIKANGTLKLFRSHHPDYKDGEQKRDFIYIKDITRWMFELMSKRPSSGIYNMGYGQAMTWLDLAKACFKSMEMPLQIDWIDIPEAIRPRYQYFTEAKMGKLLASGLSSPQWRLDQGVEDYIKRYLIETRTL